jgi:hypothetical protein
VHEVALHENAEDGKHTSWKTVYTLEHEKALDIEIGTLGEFTTMVSQAGRACAHGCRR